MFSLSFLQYGSANSFVLRGILISGLDYLPGIRIPTPDPVPYVIRHITYVLITSSCVYHQLTCHTSGISVNVEWALALLCCSGIQDKEKPAWGQSSCSQQSLTITHEQMLMWHRVMGAGAVTDHDKAGVPAISMYHQPWWGLPKVLGSDGDGMLSVADNELHRSRVYSWMASSHVLINYGPFLSLQSVPHALPWLLRIMFVLSLARETSALTFPSVSRHNDI